MEVKEKILECAQEELNNYLSLILSKNNDNFLQLCELLIKRADFLNDFKFICDNIDLYLQRKKFFNRKDFDVLDSILYANIKEKKHFKNFEIFEIIKNINFDFKNKSKLFNYVAFSYTEEKKFEEAKNILFEIKNYEDKYLENYIDALIQLNYFDEALKELKKYSPKLDHNRVWKAVHIAYLFYKKNDLIKLAKYFIKAELVYRNLRTNSDIKIHSMFLYYFGNFSLKLNNKAKAIHYYKNSINASTGMISDTIYSDKSVLKLKEMGVN